MGLNANYKLIQREGMEPSEEFETPKRKIAVLRHADADGFGAAYAIWKALKDTCEMLFISVQYGQEPPYEELRTFGPEKIFIVDFSYKAGVMVDILREFPFTVTIDHHKTAADDLETAYAAEGGKSHFVFNQMKAGCVLTWEYFHPGYEIPEILLYVGDRDLWRFELENSKEINAYIATMPEDFAEWDNFYLPDAYTAGKAVVAFQDAQIKRRLRDVIFENLAYDESGKPFFCAGAGSTDCLIPFVNASENQSELGEAMCLAYPDSPFSVSYCDRPDGNRSYSLRSRNGFDVSAMCKAFGGGGHHKEGKGGAGGFTLTAPDII